MTQEVLKLALDALETELSIDWTNNDEFNASAEKMYEAIAAIKEALAQEQEPVAWLLTEKNINSLQVDSIQLLIDRLKHAHHTDLCVRINGQDEWFQADWLKHMVRATPPQRTWVGLEGEEIRNSWEEATKPDRSTMTMVTSFARAIEARLKELNT